MKMLIFSAAALLAVPLLAGEASATTASQAQIVHAAGAVSKVDYRTRRYHRRASPAYRSWCAYNCYAVSPRARGPLGAYAYSQYRYDEDIPFRFRYDWDASPQDNALGLAYPVTGAPFLRIFERTY